MTAQEIVGLIASVPIPIGVIAFLALITRPWNIKKKASKRNG